MLILAESILRDAESMLSFLRLCSVLLTLLGLVSPALTQAPATIYLIRHAEKLTDKRPDLSQQGFLRAALIPNLFVPPAAAAARPALAKPDFLFATARSKNSNRPFETVMPLSSALNLPISNEIENDNFADLARLLLGGQFAGKIVLVAWHHGKLPDLTKALGATPPYIWPETQFDRIWRIDFADGKAKLTDLPMQLLPGDSK
jgi:hypothetical protein